MTDARELTLALGGRFHGRYGTAPCPVCACFAGWWAQISSDRGQ